MKMLLEIWEEMNGHAQLYIYIYIKNTPIHWENCQDVLWDVTRQIVGKHGTRHTAWASVPASRQSVWLAGWAPWLSQLGHTSQAAACYLEICQADGENMHCESQGHGQEGSSATAATGDLTEYAPSLAPRTKPARVQHPHFPLSVKLWAFGWRDSGMFSGG